MREEKVKLTSIFITYCIDIDKLSMIVIDNYLKAPFVVTNPSMEDRLLIQETFSRIMTILQLVLEEICWKESIQE